jgi:hypothetical protein
MGGGSTISVSDVQFNFGNVGLHWNGRSSSIPDIYFHWRIRWLKDPSSDIFLRSSTGSGKRHDI